MKFTFSWLKEHLSTNNSLEEILDRLNSIGFEVEQAQRLGEKFVVAEIIECMQHPNADRLMLCKVHDGKDELQIVCGAANARSGIKVVLAQIGAIIPNGNFEIKKSKIRGCESHGMMCSADELEIQGSKDGIIELDDNYKVGEPFQIDPVIEIAVTPNRGDALSVYGVARDLAAAGIGELKRLSFNKSHPKIGNRFKVSIEDLEKCGNYCLAYIENIKNSESPKWLSDKLESIGMKSISAVVDTANYIMLTYGTPMHVYDADKISGNELVIESCSEREDFHAIDGNNYKIPAGALVICDSEKIQCIAGIIGGKSSECTLETKNIILECANFNHVDIAVAKQKLGVNTESAYRFERQIDNEMVRIAIGVATNLILEACGGSCAGIEQKTAETKQKTIEFNPQQFERITGIKISDEKIIEILTNLGYEILEDKSLWKIKIPSWRNDITTQNCIIEETLRIYGYDKILETPFHREKTIVYKDSNKELLRKLMISRGFAEVISWSFMDEKKNVEDLGLIKIKNPIAKNLNIMRPSIVYNLHEIAQGNRRNGVKNVRVFEIGPVYKEDNKEIETLTGLRAGKSAPRNIYSDSHEMDFFDVKADFLAIMHLLNIKNYNLSGAGAPKYYHPGRSATVTLNKKIIGFIGELHPRVAGNERISAFELFADNLPEADRRTQNTISKYPQVERDFAFVFDRNLNLQDIINLIQSCSKLIKRVDLFDKYEDNELYSGKISLAFMVVMEDVEKTLDSDTINKISDLIIEKVSKTFNAILRRDYSVST